MEGTSFRLFRDLPPEIQDAIWDAAVRPATKSHVHSFIIADHHCQTFDSVSVPGFFLRFGAYGKVNGGFKLAVPHDDPNSGPNSSVYLSDSGLWMACKQSRAAMNRRFPMNEWWSEIPGKGQPERKARAGECFGQQNVAHTTSYIDSNAQVRHITIQPVEDLFYFSPLQLDSINWFHHYAFNDVPLIDYRGYNTASPASSFLGLHVALDYDPLMLETLAGRTVNCPHRRVTFSTTSIVDMVDVFHESAARTIWFIDHRLRRLEGTLENDAKTDAHSRMGLLTASASISLGDTQDGRRVFYSNDCVFTEVQREDHLSEWFMGEENGHGTVFAFFDLLHQVAGGRLEVEGSARMKVLACEVAPGAAPRPATARTGSVVCVACAEEKQETLFRKTDRLRDAESDDDGFSLEDFAHLNLL
ncbi:hypothetical protein BGZ61DRAFT_454608 [Ilyonectria robusta]|uniref:uncharacterized protein n=1 Tax=Ilyonectria robusta TaxID=1079257 RepID=UPI001E8E7DF1|nr:uncharacterized protein BGZ61DRAFT_454608 [Ilyonectria robusta]KAH8686540.1 hypothetical protein BGZ61DRAFT_454608 [Ilyonectria robusta]